MLTKEFENSIQETIYAIKINNPNIFDQNTLFFPEIKKKKKENNVCETFDLKKIYKIENLLKDRNYKKNSKRMKSKIKSCNKEYVNLIKAFQIQEKEENFFEIVEKQEKFMDNKLTQLNSHRLDKNWVPLVNNKEHDTFLKQYFSKQWWRHANVEKKNIFREFYGFQELIKEEKVAGKKFRHEERNGLSSLVSYPRLIKGSLRKKTFKRKKQFKKKEKRILKKKEFAKIIKWKKRMKKVNLNSIMREIEKKTGIQLPINYLEFEKEWNFSKWDQIIKILKNRQLNYRQENFLFKKFGEIYKLMAHYNNLKHEIY